MAIRTIERASGTAEDLGSGLVLELQIEDPIVIQVLDRADDVVEAAHRCLEVGARALTASQTCLDETYVSRSFDQLSQRLDASMTAGVDRIESATRHLLDEEDGALTRVLANLRGELLNRLGQLFDPDSKSSALALFEEVFKAAAARTSSELRATLAIDDVDSALGRWRSEMTSQFRGQADAILAEVRGIATSLEVDAARAEVFDKTSLKGVAYEDVVHVAFAEAARHRGDVIEDTSRQRGTTGSLVGDLVVTFDADDVCGELSRMVIEVKARRLSLRKTLDELEAGMANREAQVGIAIFASKELAPPGHAVFVPHGNLAVMVLDKESPESPTVELAMAWARMRLRHLQIRETATDGDPQVVTEAIATATRALDRAATIRRCHSTVRRQIDQAGEELTDLVTEARDAIVVIRDSRA
jgi:hypothetical protein